MVNGKRKFGSGLGQFENCVRLFVFGKRESLNRETSAFFGERMRFYGETLLKTRFQPFFLGLRGAFFHFGSAVFIVRPSV